MLLWLELTTMTENELLSRQYFKEIFILNSLYKKLINFVEDERQCRKVGYKRYKTEYWYSDSFRIKSYIISHIDYYGGIRVDFIKYLYYEGLYSIQMQFEGISYMSCIKRFYRDKKCSLDIMSDLQERFLYLYVLTSKFYVSQSQELLFHPLEVLKYIKTEISEADISGFIKVDRQDDKYHIIKFDTEGLDSTSKLVDQIITGEIHQGL